MVDGKFQVPTNLALVQAGTQDVRQAGFVTGALEGQPLYFDWEDLQYVFMRNNPTYVSLFEDFLESGVTLSSQYTVTSNGTAAGTTVNATVAGGVAAMAGGTDDNGFTQIATNRAWVVGNGTTLFATRFKKNTATAHAIEVGVSTAANIATDGQLFSDHTAAGVTASANISTNRCIVVGADSDSSATVLSVAAFDGTSASAVDSTAAFDTEWHTAVFVLTYDGSTQVTRVYVDDVLVATLNDIFTTTSAITFYASSKSLSGSNATTLYLDYVALCGDRF